MLVESPVLMLAVVSPEATGVVAASFATKLLIPAHSRVAVIHMDDARNIHSQTSEMIPGVIAQKIIAC